MVPTSLQELRDWLIERAKYGEISGAEADREAVKAGLEPFAMRPDPAVFDPDREAYWTLPMAVAWIAYRSSDSVREAWDKYCAECWHWIWRRWRVGLDGNVHEGWFLEQWLRPTLAKLALSEALDATGESHQPSVMSIEESREALWSALREGLIEATGLDMRTERRVGVPAMDWQELTSVEGRGEIDEVRYGPLGLGYRDVLVPRKIVRVLWSATREKPLELPRLVPPDGDGYMPLYCAAQWIASKGGAVIFDPEDDTIWRPAYAALINAVASDRVRAVGTRNGSKEQVPGFHFAGCEVDYPFASASNEMMMGENLYLRSYPYIDEEHWRDGLDDALANRSETRWSRLMVAKDDIREIWPYDLSRPNRSGAPGRPTSMHLVLEELARRGAVNELEASVGAEAAALATWLSATCTGVPSLTAKTIANRIRSIFRELKARN